MKKTLLLLLILPLFNYGLSAQVLDFKTGYSPETIYNQTTISSSDYKVTYTGSEKTLDLFKKNGTQNPSKIKNRFTVETVSKTGKIDQNGNFPITIEYVKSIDKKGNSIIPSGTMLYGNATLSSMPQMDSIVADNAEESFKNAIFETVKSTFSQLVMPQKKLKIGESFVQESPLTIPIAGVNIEMVINTTYILKSMNSKNAFFDITQTYTMKLLDNRFETEGTGTGTGKLIYDIPHHFIYENIMDMELDLNLKHTDFGINLTSKNRYKQKAQISTNN
ncbi:hypothetical protein ACFFLS_06640 [Flavobacterium procerum]|uniref:Uncharacterized protein n=1 Tax=Flavobacterium procerum TaxID=1455569 RepID=A0ABV6BP25_9FLAO